MQTFKNSHGSLRLLRRPNLQKWSIFEGFRYSYYKWIFGFFSIVFLAGCGAFHSDAAPPAAVDGVLDLSQWDFRAQGSVPLNGIWAFYGDALLTPGLLGRSNPPQPSGMMTLPRSWNGYVTGDGRTFGADGYATFRLTIKLPAPNATYAIRVPPIATAFILWADDQELIRAGKVGTSRSDSVPQYKPGIRSIRPRGDTLTLTIQVSNFDHRRGGIWTGLAFGLQDQMTHSYMRSVVSDAFIAGSLLIIAVHHFGLFFLRRQERSPLYFSLFCILTGVRTLVVGNALITKLLPGLTWTFNLRIEYLCTYLGLPLFLAFIGRLFPNETDRRIVRGLPLVSGLLALGVAVLPPKLFMKTLLFDQLLTVVISFSILSILIRASLRRREGATLASSGAIVYGMLIFHSILYYDGFLGGADYSSYGLIFFVIMHAFILSIKSARAYRAEAVMSTELKELNSGLEAKITERTLALEQSYKRLEHIHEELARVENSRRRLLSNTSHDLGTPITLIQGYVEALVDGVAEEPAQQKKYLSLIHSRVLGLNRLIADLFELSKLEARQIGFQFRELDAAELIAYVNERYELEITGAGFHYFLCVIGEEPSDKRCIHIDLGRIDQVLTNIIYNAIKYTPRGGQILIRFVYTEEGRLRVEIADSGEGIDPEDIPYLFDRFYKKDKSRNTAVGGSGLGLAISKEIVEFHGGTIGVACEAGGATFFFTLPLFAKEEDPALATEVYSTQM